jgi:hypothetical protein
LGRSPLAISLQVGEDVRVKCWNCLHNNPKKAHRCERCDQALKPSSAQKIAGRRKVEYLLQELDNWQFLDEDTRAQARSVYNRRLDRLTQVGSKAVADWPESDWQNLPVPGAEGASPAPFLQVETPVVTDSTLETPRPVESPDSEATSDRVVERSAPAQEKLVPPITRDFLDSEPSAPGYLERLTGEADIRWFHSLGALLVVAAMVGWLRTSWDSYGRSLTGVLIALSPVMLHLTASRLKKAVPLSARLLSILANVLTPLALLSLDVFENLPPQVPSDLYWTFSMLVSAAVLTWQAHSTREKIPLYIGGLCCVMAGWSQGALATAAFSLGIGFLFQWNRAEEDPEWQHHRQQMSFLAGSFGALASLLLFETARHPAVPLVAFTGALLFLSLPTLTGQSTAHPGKRLALQTVVTIVGSLLMRSVLHLSPGGVALYLLFACALFLAVKPDSPFALASARIASVLGVLALGIGFLSGLPEVLSTDRSLAEALLRVTFAVLGALFFFRQSRATPMASAVPPLFVLSLCSLLGGWVHLFLNFILVERVDKLDHFLPLIAGMVLFEGMLIVASRWLREREQNLVWVFTFPLLLGSLALTALGQLMVPIEWSGWTLTLVLHGALALCWERQWLAPSRLPEPQEIRLITVVLPRVVFLAEVLALFTAYGVDKKMMALVLFGAHLVASFLLKDRYREGAWEATWGLALLCLPYVEKEALFLVALAVNALGPQSRSTQVGGPGLERDLWSGGGGQSL